MKHLFKSLSFLVVFFLLNSASGQTSRFTNIEVTGTAAINSAMISGTMDFDGENLINIGTLSLTDAASVTWGTGTTLTDPENLRGALSLGDVAFQSADNVGFTGGTLDNVTITSSTATGVTLSGTTAISGTVSGNFTRSGTTTGGTLTGITDIAVVDGGTGASDKPTARANLDAAVDFGSPIGHLLPNVTRRMVNTSPPRSLRVLMVGDSIAAGLSEKIRAALIGIYGDAGYGINSIGTKFTNAAGGAAVTTSTNWVGQVIATLPPGGSVDLKYNTTGTSIGNVLKMFYFKEPDAGTWKLQSSIDGSTWSDEVTGIDASNATMIGAVAKPATKSAANTYMLRALNTGVSGTVRVIGGQISNSLVDGVQWHDLTLSGRGLVDFIASPSDVIDPILTEISPDLVIYCNYDTTADQVAHLATLRDRLDTTGTTDFLWLAMPPNNIASPDNATEQNAAIKAYADSVGDSYYDAWDGVTYAKFNADGLSVDGLHATNAAYDRMAGMVLQFPLGGMPRFNPVSATRSVFNNVEGQWEFRSLATAPSLKVYRSGTTGAAEIVLRALDPATYDQAIIRLHAASDATNPSATSIGGFTNRITIGKQNGIGYGRDVPTTTAHDFAGINSRSTMRLFQANINPGDILGFFDSGTTKLASVSSLGQAWFPKLFVSATSGSATVVADINGGLRIRSSGTTVNLTADDTTVTVGDRSYIRMSSDSAVAADRTFLLGQSTLAGQVLVLEWTDTDAATLVDDSAQGTAGNHRLSADWVPTQYDTISLISNGTDWVETGRSTN